MARLNLSLLGSFLVELDGKAISDFATDKARALLAYLALEAQRPQRRDALAGLLWPEQPQQKARQNLRQALSYLRRAIADHDEDTPFLLVERETVQFNPQADYWLDTAAFTALLEACQAHRHRRLTSCQSCAQRLEQAAELYRGNFLAQFYLGDSVAFEEWTMLKREWLHRQAVEAFLRLADCYERRADYARARHYAWRQVELDPWREEAHRQLMRLLAFEGQRSAALAQYEACRRTLAAELGVEPTVETTALYERILAGENSPSYPRPPANPHNIPPAPTPFVGRARELAELDELLANPDCRLLTLVGPGGIGKSRLALQAAAKQMGAFAQGVYFVPLNSINAPEFIVPAIANALQFPFYSHSPPQEQLEDYLREKEMLLVLDGLEHVLEGVGLLSDVLARAPGIVFVATSRERLNLREEWVHEVRGLDYPTDETLALEAATYSAVDLFVQSASRARPRFTLSEDDAPFVANICHMVEGTPLGVELAAAWATVCTCQEIAQEIARSLDFLTSAQRRVPERHRSLRAVFSHSWNLLAEAEQRIFARLSVFRGSFQRQAAQQVAGASPPTLLALVDKSLLRQTSSGRYQVHELLRQYAAEMALPELVGAQTLHSRYYMTFLQELQGENQRQTLQAIGDEIDNVRSAWQWAVEQGKLELIERGLNALASFYYFRGPFQVGETLIRSAVDRAREMLKAADPAARDTRVVLSKLLIEHARLLVRQDLYEQAIAAAQEAIQLGDHDGQIQAEGHLLCGRAFLNQGNYPAAQGQFEQALDSLTERLGTMPPRQLLADSLRNLANVLVRRGDYEQAKLYCEGALNIYREIDDRQGESAALNNLGTAMYYQGDYAGAESYYDQARSIYAASGDRRGESKLLNNLGNLYADQGDYAQALDCCEQALRIHREVGSRMGETIALNNLAATLWTLGDYAGAGGHYERAWRTSCEIGDRPGEGAVLCNLSLLAHLLGDDEAALVYGQRALLITQELGDQKTQGDSLTYLGHAQAGLGQLVEAAATYQRALDLRRALGQLHRGIENLSALAQVALAQDDLLRAQTLVEEILSYLESNSLDGTDEPFRVYLTCYHVLRANQDPRATTILDSAQRLLQEHAAKISDERLRRSFLDNVAAHREIVAAYEKRKPDFGGVEGDAL